jgi:hypothetical protein
MKPSVGSRITTAYRPERTERITDNQDDYKQEAFLRLLQTEKGRAILERVLYSPDEDSVRYFMRSYKAARIDHIRYLNRLRRDASNTEPLFDRDFTDHASESRFSDVEAADELASVLRDYNCPELQRFLKAYRIKESGERVPQTMLNQLVKDRRTSGLKLQLT